MDNGQWTMDNGQWAMGNGEEEEKRKTPSVCEDADTSPAGAGEEEEWGGRGASLIGARR